MFCHYENNLLTGIQYFADYLMTGDFTPLHTPPHTRPPPLAALLERQEITLTKVWLKTTLIRLFALVTF
jgi:hypothetical protein